MSRIFFEFTQSMVLDLILMRDSENHLAAIVGVRMYYPTLRDRGSLLFLLGERRE